MDKDDITKFTSIKWIEIFDQSNGTYNPNNDIRFKTPQIRADLCDFNDAYIVVTGKITATNPGNNINVHNRKVALKNSAHFFNCILNINNQLIEDVQDLDIVMPMLNLLYCSKKFRKTTGSFWDYYPDKPNSGHDNNANLRERITYPIKNSESLVLGTLPAAADFPNGNDVEAESDDIKVIVPLKNLSNFIFSLNFLMINTEIELILKWSQNCVLTEKAEKEEKAETPNNVPPQQNAVPAINRPKDLKFDITDCKLYVSAVTLQEKYDNEFFDGSKNGIDIDLEWKRYRTQIINQPTTNNLNFLIDPTFKNANRLFVLAFTNEEGFFRVLYTNC